MPHAKNAKDAKGSNAKGERKETRPFLANLALPARICSQADLEQVLTSGRDKLVLRAKDAKDAKGSKEKEMIAKMNRRSVFAAAIVVLCAISMSVAVLADVECTIRVGAYENSPKIFTDEEGVVSGFWPDLVNYIASEENWQIEWVHGTWTQCLERLQEDKIDIMPDVALTEERSTKYRFSNEIVLPSWSEVYTREGTDIDSILDLEGKTVAVLKGSVNVEGPGGIKELVRKFDVTCTLIEVDSYLKAFQLVQGGEVDAGITNKDFGTLHSAAYGLHGTAIIFQPVDNQFALPIEGSLTPYLAETIDRHIKALKHDDQSIYYRALAKHLDVKPEVLTVRVLPGWAKDVLWIFGVAIALFLVALLVSRREVRRRTAAFRESEERFRDLYENAPNVYFSIGVDGLIRMFNHRAEDLLGYTGEELMEKPVLDLYADAPSGREKARKILQQFVSGEAVYGEELQMQRADGQLIWINLTVSPVRDRQGQVVASRSIVVDISERKEMQAQREHLLAEVETARDLLAGVFERISDGVVALDKDWHYTYVNRRAAIMLNRDKPEDLLGKHIWTEYPEGVGQPFYKAYYKAMQTQKPVYLEEHYEPWDRWFENRIYPSPDGLTIYFTEVTERAQAQEKQRKTHRSLKVLSECNQMMVRVGQESELLSELCRIMVDVGGYKAAWIGYAEDDERKTVRPVAQAGFEEGYLNTLNITWADTERGRGPTGTAIRTDKISIAQDMVTDPELARWRVQATEHGYASSLALPLHVNDHVLGALNIFASEPDAFDADELKLLMELSGDLSYGINALRNRAEREKAEAKIEQERDLTQTYLDIAAVAMVALDNEGRITLVNRQGLTMLGYSEGELLGEDWFATCIPPGMRGDVRSVFEQLISGEAKQVEYFENAVLRKDGEKRIITWQSVFLKDESGNITGTLSSGQDITERKRAEEEKQAMEAQLRQSQKLESIGTLASGVAHEINNPLTGMINYADLIEERVKDDELRKFAQGIMKEGNRVAEIVKSLLSFARQEKQSHSPARMQDIIDASLTLVGAVLRKDQITLEKEIAPDLPQVRCRSQQIEQVIINLLTNARDALNQRYEGYDENKVVKIVVEPFEKDDVEWVRTTIEDHGNGISEEIIARVFDPFFTTKSRTEGTGLGLSVSHGIIKEHHGELSVESKLGEYTRFHIDLRVNNGWSLG